MPYHTPETWIPWRDYVSYIPPGNVNARVHVTGATLADAERHRDYTLSCVNALAGKDPEKLGDALKAADDLCVSLRAQQDIFKQTVCNMVAMATNDLLDALAALEQQDD